MTVKPTSPRVLEVFGRVVPMGDAVAAAFIGLLLVAFAPWTMFPSWTPRAAVMLLALPIGAVALGALALRRDRVALAAVAFVVWVWVSALVSPAPRSATFGFVGRDLSAIALTASVGLWAIGRGCTAATPRLITRVLVIGAATNAVVATLQVIVGVDTGSLALFAGRPTGFLVNPVYLGAVCAAGAAVAALAVEPSRSPMVAGAFVCSVGCTLSGSRVAWVALIAIVVAAAFLLRRCGRMVGAASVLGGIAFGLLLDQVFTGSRNSLDRVSVASEGRWTLWRYALEAALERPIAGHGVGRFRAAVQGRFSTEFVRATALDETQQAWFDAHNVVVGLAVATGVIGLAIAAGWVWLCARRASGPLAWGAAAIALTWTLQPVSLHTLPVAMLLLGASMSGAHSLDDPWAIVPLRLLAPVAGVSVVLSVGLLVADARLKSATDRRSVESTTSAARWFGDDPVVADVVAQVARTRFGADFADADSLHWREVAASREPDRPYWWNQLAIEQIELGDYVAADESAHRSLELAPANYLGNLIGLDLAIRSQDRVGIEGFVVVLCELDDQYCELEVADLMQSGG